jgi:hypothetical protein
MHELYVPLIVVVIAADCPTARLAEPDSLSIALADGLLHLLRVHQRVGRQLWPDQAAERRLGTLGAETPVPVP